jgi:hypothetical protein
MKQSMQRTAKGKAIGACVVLLLALGWGTAAWGAAYGSCTATLHWEDLILTNAVPVIYDDVSTAKVWEDALTDEDLDEAASSTVPPATYADARIHDTQGRALTGASLLEETVYACSTQAEQAASFAMAGRIVEFEVIAPGVVSVEVPYSIEMDLFTMEDMEWAVGNATAFLGLLEHPEDGAYAADSARDLYREVSNGDVFDIAFQGKLYIDWLFLQAGDIGAFEATVMNSAEAVGVTPLPIPGPLLLLGAGLLGLIGTGRRLMGR